MIEIVMMIAKHTMKKYLILSAVCDSDSGHGMFDMLEVIDVFSRLKFTIVVLL
jgi:hypothetical protein